VQLDEQYVVAFFEAGRVHAGQLAQFQFEVVESRHDARPSLAW
jgi:hypothetical protein